MTKYNKTRIMKDAWTFYRANRYGTFGECLHRAWENAKAFVKANEENGEARTWFNWTLFGREVIHGEQSTIKFRITDPTTKDGTRGIALFTYEQTCELGTQPPKAV